MKNRIKIHFHHKSDATIDDYFYEVMDIWKRDAEERTVFDIWLRVVDYTSRLAEAIRRERPVEVLDALAESIMWFLNFIAQLHQSLNIIDEPFKITKKPSDIIWDKYPGLCPACFDNFVIETLEKLTGKKSEEKILESMQENDEIIYEKVRQYSTEEPLIRRCTCLSKALETEERHNKYRQITEEIDNLRLFYADITRKHKISKIDEISKMFEDIFRNTYQVLSIESIAFHLLEEVGEISKAIVHCYSFDKKREPYTKELYTKKIKLLEEELADVFSWLYALLIKIKLIYYRDAQQFFQSTLDIVEAPLKNITLGFLESISMSNIIWLKYGKDKEGNLHKESLICYGCFKNPCRCERDLRIDWSRVIQTKINPKQNFHIYYHVDFDGIASASLLTKYLSLRHGIKNEKIITKPVDFDQKPYWNKKQFEKPFGIVDFLYHPDARYWADHHHHPFVSDEFANDYDWKASAKKSLFWVSNIDSTAAIIFNNLIPRVKDLVNEEDIKRFEQIVMWAGKIDAARYKDVAEWFNCESSALKLNLIILYNNKAELMDFIIKELVEKDFNDIMSEPKMKNYFIASKQKMDSEFAIFSTVAQRKGNIVFFNISKFDNYRYHRFFPYKYYENALVTVGIYRKEKAFEVSVGKNPWIKIDDYLNIDIGHLCVSLGGGGHKHVGGITVKTVEDAEAIAEKIINFLSEILKPYN